MAGCYNPIVKRIQKGGKKALSLRIIALTKNSRECIKIVHNWQIQGGGVLKFFQQGIVYHCVGRSGASLFFGFRTLL